MMAKLVLVEDDITMLGLLETLFQLEGYRAIRFIGASSDDLLHLLQCEKPDVLLMDVNLRHFNGLEIIPQLHKEPDLNQMSIIMTSGVDLRDQCLKAGANAFIMKPFIPDELLNVIRDLLTK
jgi:DNA-binding response OmpR family regulator